MSPTQRAAATPASAPAAIPAAIQPQDDALAVDRQRYSRPAPAMLDSAQALDSPSVQAGPVTDQSQQAGSVHVVAFGDSLWSIAQRYYGDATRWRAIYDANAAVIGPNWNLIYPGTRLTIPGSQTGCVGFYTVQSGDSLWLIAQRSYGTGAAWSAIYGANSGAIGANPNLIYPGMTLRMPC